MFRLKLLLFFTCFLLIARYPAVADEATATAEPHAAIKPAPRGGWWGKKHEGINAQVAKGDVDLLFLGDSITDAWSNPGKVVWQKYYAHRNAVNAGISGDRTQHVLWRMQNGTLKGITPKVAVIMIGTNNSGSNTSEEIADGITAIVDLLAKETPETKVLLLGIFPRGANADDAKRKVNAGANAIVAKLAERPTVTYLDIGPAFLDDEGTLSRKVMPDLLHLTPGSYGTWATAMEPTLAKLLGDEPVQ